MVEMIRDRLVVGILDKRLSEKLQLYPELTLEQVGLAEGSGTRASAGTQWGK